MPSSSGLKTTDESAGVDFLESVEDDEDDRATTVDLVSLSLAAGRAPVSSSPNSYSSLSSLAAPILEYDWECGLLDRWC